MALALIARCSPVTCSKMVRCNSMTFGVCPTDTQQIRSKALRTIGSLTSIAAVIVLPTPPCPYVDIVFCLLLLLLWIDDNATILVDMKPSK